MTKQQIKDMKKCEELQEQGIDMDCFECSCNCCIAQENVISPDVYKVAYKALTLACEVLKNIDAHDEKIESYKAKGSLIGMFLMDAEKELNT